MEHLSELQTVRKGGNQTQQKEKTLFSISRHSLHDTAIFYYLLYPISQVVGRSFSKELPYIEILLLNYVTQ